MKYKLGIALMSTIMFFMLAAPSSQAANQRASKKQAGKQAQKKQAPKPAESSHQHDGHAAEHKAAEAGEAGRITVEELKAKIEKNEPVTILDVRSEGSYESSDKKIKGAIRMLTDEIESRLKEIPQDRTVVTYCT